MQRGIPQQHEPTVWQKSKFEQMRAQCRSLANEFFSEVGDSIFGESDEMGLMWCW